MTLPNKKIRLGATADVESLNGAMQEVERFLNKLLPFVAVTDDAAPSSGIHVLAIDSTGVWRLYDLVQGTGVTLTLDEGAQTLTVSSP